MRTTTKNQKSLGILSSILIGLGVVLFSWIIFSPDSRKTQTIPSVLADEPDYYAKKATMGEYNSDGNLEYRLKSDSVRHYESRLVTELLKPQITILDSNQTPWSIRAETGLMRSLSRATNIESKDDQLVFKENVVVSNEGPPIDAFLLRTEILFLYPHSRYIESDSNILIETKQYRITAANMNSHLNTRWMDLGSSQEQRVIIQDITHGLE